MIVLSCGVIACRWETSGRDFCFLTCMRMFRRYFFTTRPVASISRPSERSDVVTFPSVLIFSIVWNLKSLLIEPSGLLQLPQTAARSPFSSWRGAFWWHHHGVRTLLIKVASLFGHHDQISTDRSIKFCLLTRGILLLKVQLTFR